MSFSNELRTRIARYEAERQRIDELIAHARALLGEEERQAMGQLPLPSVIAAPALNGHQRRRGSIPEAVGRVLPAAGVVRFSQVVADVRTLLPERQDDHELGKQVSAALRRAVENGRLERVARGVYRRRLEQPV